MKKITIAIFSLFISFTSQAQWEKNKENTTLKTEKRTVEDFTSVHSKGGWNVEITYGKSNEITLKGDDDLLDNITTKVEDGVLIISTKNNTYFKTKYNTIIFIQMTELKDLILSGSSNVKGNGDFFNTGKSKFKLSGSGNVDFKFGKIAEIDISLSGSGNYNFAGTTEKNNISISGSGNVEALKVTSNIVTVNISGSGNASVHANESLQVKISGSGNVKYTGNTTNISKTIMGSGFVRKV
jgi:Putative auto-transporter adhesin, head GIN domain